MAADAADDTDDSAFRALASEPRRRILRLVRDDARAVGELADELGVSQPAVSQHLAVLREAGLVTVAPVGRRRLYRVDREALTELQSFFDRYWESALDRLESAAVQDAADRREAS